MFLKSVYSTLFLDPLKSGKFLISVKNETTVDGSVDMITLYAIHSCSIELAHISYSA